MWMATMARGCAIRILVGSDTEWDTLLWMGIVRHGMARHEMHGTEVMHIPGSRRTVNRL